MPAKGKLNLDKLEALGPKRLAELLMELAERDTATNRLLRLELAAKEAPERVAGEVRKRLTQLVRARSFVDRHKIRDLAADLEMQRRTIVDRVASLDATEALELMWRFMDLAEAIQERCDDSDGVIGDVFRSASRDLGSLAQAAKPDPVALADRAFAALNENGYGQHDGLIEVLAAALGNKGLDRLKALFIELSKTPVVRPQQDERKVIGWGMGGRIYQDEIEARGRERTIRGALQQIADAQGDVDAFIDQYDQQTRKVPEIAAEIARRLLATGRAEEALQTIEAAEQRGSRRLDLDWADARIETLDMLGRGDEAQAARWSCFERVLSDEHLRAYLERLPDFDDIAAEERALDFAERHEDVLGALTFLVAWPALDRAARVATLRTGKLDGDHYEVLSPAADALAGKYPLAATLVFRAMIDFALTKGRSSRYRHAARHFLECAGLAPSIPEFGAFETHETYAARLMAEHGRKRGFWGLIS